MHAVWRWGGALCLVALYTLVDIVGVSAAATSGPVFLKWQLDCDHGKGPTKQAEVANYRVAIEGVGSLCRISIAAKVDAGHAVFEQTGPRMQVFANGADLDGDGNPDVIVQTETFEATSGNILSLITLGPSPHLVLTLTSGYGFFLTRACDDNRVRIATWDSAFQDDEELTDIYHYDLMTPMVFFEVRGGRVTDWGPQCRKFADDVIQDERKNLSVRTLQEFRANQIKDDFKRGQVKGAVLHIVFAYLYSGRQDEALRSLRGMWPAGDVDRVWDWMLMKRSSGVLKQATGA